MSKILKTYRAKTHVHISVTLKSGAGRHVSFSPLTGGGSIFYTDDADLQAALEAHYKFGHLYKLVGSTTVGEPEKPQKPAGRKPVVKDEAPASVPTDTGKEEQTPPADAGQQEPPEDPSGEEQPSDEGESGGDASGDEGGADNEEAGEPADGKIHIPYTNLQDAGDYLVKKFEVSRTKVRTTAQVKAFADANGVVFDGLVVKPEVKK